MPTAVDKWLADVNAAREQVPHWTPEHRLLIALLLEALQSAVAPAGHVAPVVQAEAWSWFWRTTDEPFSAIWVCEMLRLPLADVQRVVAAQRAEHVAERLQRVGRWRPPPERIGNHGPRRRRDR